MQAKPPYGALRSDRVGHVGYAKYLGEPLELIQVARCDALDEFSRTRSQVNFDSARIDRAATLLDEAIGFATLDQGDGSLVARIEAIRQLTDGCPLAPVESTEMEQKQVLQQRNSRMERRFLAESLESRESEAKLGESGVLLLAYQGARSDLVQANKNTTP